VHVSLTSTDALSGVASSFWALDSGAGQVYSGTFDVTAEGTTSVGFGSLDNAGNRETTKTATVRIDTTPPLSALSGVPGSWASTT